VGADFLRQLGFSERTAKLVEGHVQAKRYLCFSEEEYYSKLSAGSKFTLKHQGGVMTEKEAADFAKDPEAKTMLAMRTWDERAKVVGLVIPPPLNTFDSYAAMMSKGLRSSLWVDRTFLAPEKIISDEQIRSFQDEGYIVLENWLTEAEKDVLSEYADFVTNLPSCSKNGPFHTYESIEGKKCLSRTEGFAHMEDEWNLGKFLMSGRLKQIIKRLRGGREVVLLKDKINYKFKGGSGGYRPHQDLYYSLKEDRTSGKLEQVRMLEDWEANVCMIAVDEMTVSNGCPHLAPKMHSKGWLQYDDMLSAPLKNIRVEDKKTKDSMQWKSVEVNARAV